MSRIVLGLANRLQQNQHMKLTVYKNRPLWFKWIIMEMLWAHFSYWPGWVTMWTQNKISTERGFWSEREKGGWGGERKKDRNYKTERWRQRERERERSGSFIWGDNPSLFATVSNPIQEPHQKQFPQTGFKKNLLQWLIGAEILLKNNHWEAALLFPREKDKQIDKCTSLKNKESVQTPDCLLNWFILLSCSRYLPYLHSRVGRNRIIGGPHQSVRRGRGGERRDVVLDPGRRRARRVQYHHRRHQPGRSDNSKEGKQAL